jgi:succinylglutamate desuccinylase
MQNNEYQDVITAGTERIRWTLPGDMEGPVLVVFAGIHGNETAGVHAIDSVASDLMDSVDDSDADLNGTVYSITGNIKALELGVRYVDTDLNRLWENGFDRSHYSPSGTANHTVEYKESLEIKRAVEWILDKHREKASRFIFVDLHTTSSESCAFILINDTLANRDLARKFPVPQILGFEENIRGTLLSYINNIGHLSLGFEAGAHTNEASIQRSKAFLRLVLHWLQIRRLSKQEAESCERELDIHPDVPDSYYEVTYHKIVEDPSKFEMKPGFQNFDRVEKGDPLAEENGEIIEASVSGRIFMPLYQNKGHDGFLIINEVSAFWLKLSAYLRKSFVHKLLRYLPGVRVENERTFKIDLRVAKFLVKDIFHLFGYRVVKTDEHTVICYRR